MYPMHFNIVMPKMLERRSDRMQQEITWIECDGGPHILIERKYLKLWKTAKQEDYEETAQIEEYIGELRFGTGKCLVLSEDIPSSTWLSDNNTSGFIVVINYASENAIHEGLKADILYHEFLKIPEAQFTDTNIIYQVTDEVLYLIAACDFGSGWHYNYCQFDLMPGNYSIKIIEEYILDGSSFRLFLFKKQ